MDERELIEKKDAELLHSVRNIIRDKELEKERLSKSQKKRGFSFLFLIVGTAALGGLVGLFLSGTESPKPLHSQTLVNKLPEITGESQHHQKGSWPSVWSGDVKKKDYPETATVPTVLDKAETEPPVYYKDPEADESVEEKTIASNTVISPEPLKKAQPAPPPPVELAAAPVPAETAASIPDIKISETAVCGSITNREPGDRRNRYSVSDDDRVYVFTEVRTKELPTTINHIYYVDGRKMCDVPLAVKYPRTRTWSRVRLNSENKAGKYRVEVVTKEGNILEIVNFEVAL